MKRLQKLAGSTWKSYYGSERENRIPEILARMESIWDTDGAEEAAFLKNGALSFPHVFLDRSMDPLIRTVRAVLRTGSNRVIALGPIHMGNWGENIVNEFCLDGFNRFLEIASEHFSLPKPDVKNILVTRPENAGPNEMDLIISHLKATAMDLSSSLDEGAALVMTGDLSHYGHAYGTKDPLEDPFDLIHGWCGEALDLLYIKKDYKGTIVASRRTMNDQPYPGIVASMALGGDLEYKVFSYDLADYSEVLESRRPTVVASVLYGVRRKR